MLELGLDHMVFLFQGARAPKGPGSHRSNLFLSHCLLHRMLGWLDSLYLCELLGPLTGKQIGLVGGVGSKDLLAPGF